jgi:branched-chain amino acid transport system substrate-binding protein
MLKKIMLTGLTLALVIIGILVFEKPATAETIKIGAIFGLTGPGAQWELGGRDVLLLCRDWINEKGGVAIKGEKYLIEIIVEDSKTSTSGCVSAATKLVSKDGVKFIIGGAVPVQVDAIASVTEPKKVLYAATLSDIVRPDRPLSFVSCGVYGAPIPSLYAALLQLYPSVKKVGYIVEDEPGGRATGEISQKIAQGFRLEVLEPQLHPFEASEYYPQWTKIISQKPDAVDIGLKFLAQTAGCIRQGRELGFKGPMFNLVPGDPGAILHMIGNKEYATDFIYSGFNAYGTEAPPIAKEVVQRWGKTHKDPFNSTWVNSWDNLWTLVQAIEKAQSLDSIEVAKTWEKMDTIQTSKGPAKMGGAKTFGINHIVFGLCPMTRLQKGEIEFIKWFDSFMP